MVDVYRNFLHCLSPNIEQAFEDYMALPLDKVREAEAPLMFISFPSAKDPTWHERNPSNPITVLPLYYNVFM